MNKITTLHFFCGKMAAGKSTLARKLALKHNAVLLSEDEWLILLYPEEINNIQDYLKYSLRLKNVLSAHIQSLLSQGISVVLDFPGNTPKQRAWFRHIYTKSDTSHILHFIDADNETCLHQLKTRNRGKTDNAAFTSEAEFNQITAFFEPPQEDEGFNIVRYSPKLPVA